MTLQHITLEEVKTACRKAYDAGDLIAQRGGKVYGYRLNAGWVCAIGCALTGATIKLIKKHHLQCVTLNDFAERAKLPFTYADTELEGLMGIQMAHDLWLSHPEPNPNYEARFLALIDHPDADPYIGAV